MNTNPNFVRGIIYYLRTKFKNVKITIGEGSVVTEYESTSYNFHHQGWDTLAKEEDVELVDLNKTERYSVPWFYGELQLPKIMLDKTYINIAKMKTHIQTIVSLCLKNQKGVLHPSIRKQFHKLGLHQPIAKLAEVLKPDLCLVDGTTIIEGNGPGDLGKERNFGVVVIGDNILEVDKTCCKLMGINPNFVEHIRLLSYQHPESDYSNLISSQLPTVRLPDSEFKMFRTHMRPENACSACLSSVGKTNKLARKSIKGVKYFSSHGLLNRLDIIVGSPKTLPSPHGFCIFYGNCSKELASQNPEYPFIAGCPPASKTALQELIHFDLRKT